MKLVLTYFAVGIDGHGATAHFPIEAESKEIARAAIREAAEWATVSGEEEFEAFGEQHYTHNFVGSIPAKRLEYARMMAMVKGRPAPVYFDARGEHHTFKGFTLLTVDEWFSKATTPEEAMTA